MANEFLNGLESIFGSGKVSAEAETLGSYSGDMSFIPRRKPDAVVWPDNREQVQELVKWANKTSTPLIPVSSGAPHFRGDTIPHEGGVIVDLSNMKKVVRINKRNRVMVIEPGVTFKEIQPELAKHGLRIITPLMPRSTKSVIGSVLEREPCLGPRYHWDVSDPMCCMEVVFGTGDFFRTGEAAGPGGLEAQWKIGGAQKFPSGPHQLDYHRLVQGAQGTLGIATWASIKCELLPRAQKLFFVPGQTLEELIEFTYQIVRLTLGEEVFIANSATIASLIGKTAEEIEALQQTLPAWTVIHCLNGFERHPDERIAYQELDMLETGQKCGVKPVTGLNGLGSGKMLKTINSISEDPYWKLTRKGGCHDIFFITTLDKSSKYLKVMHNAALAAGYPVNDIGVYLQPVVQGTSCHMEFQLPYNPENEAEAARAKTLFTSMSKALMKEGAFFSRPYPGWAYDVYRSRADIVPPLKKVKSVFDPNNIMNPGKLCF